MPLGRDSDGAGGCYTIPMGLCYDCGFEVLTVALALRLPGDYPLPLGSRRGINQHGELAVAEGPLWGEQPTAGRELFSFNCGEGVRESVADLLRHSLTAKGGNRGCRAGQLCWTAGQVPLFLWDVGIGTAAGAGNYRPSSALLHRPIPLIIMSLEMIIFAKTYELCV